MFKENYQIHPTLKFTMVHTSVDKEAEEDQCDCAKTTSIPFLDTKIQNFKIDIAFYKK